MAVKQMDFVAKDDDGSSRWMWATQTISGGTYGDIYKCPFECIYAIGAVVTGSGSWEFAIDPIENLESSATWSRWNGTSDINKAITGFRLVRDSGTVVGKIMIKTTYA